MEDSSDLQFKTKLSILTAIDFTIGVALFILSLDLLDDYLANTKDKTAIMTAILTIFAICFVTDPVMSLAVLLRHTQADQVDEGGLLRKWLKMCNGLIILVIPEMFFFLTFYNLYEIQSSVGFILCICKLVLYFHKFSLISNYLQQRRLTTYNNGSGSITPEVPSYGAFGPPTYEDAIKLKDDAPPGYESYMPAEEKET